MDIPSKKIYFNLPHDVCVVIDTVKNTGTWSCPNYNLRGCDTEILDALLKVYIDTALKGVDIESDDACRQAIIEFFSGVSKKSS